MILLRINEITENANKKTPLIRGVLAYRGSCKLALEPKFDDFRLGLVFVQIDILDSE